MIEPTKTHYFRRFLAYALDYKGLLALAIGMGVVKFWISFSFPWLMGTALDRVVAPVAGTASAAPAARDRWLWIVLGLGVLFSLLHAVGTFGRGFYTAKLGNRIIADLRQDLFDHLHRLSLHFYSKERTGSIVSRLINDIQQASQLINGGIVSAVMDSTSLLIGTYLLMGISWKVTLAALAVLPLYGITFRYFNPRVKTASLRVQSQLSKISGNVQERLAGIALVKTYAAEEREREQFVADTEEHFDRVLTQSSLAQAVGSISELLVHIGQALVIALSGWLALRGSPALTAGDVTKALGYVAVMYLPVRRMAEINIVYQTSLASIQRVFEVFDITPKIVEKPQAVAQSPARGEVRFEAASFSYFDESDESKVNLEEAARQVDRTNEPAAEIRALERAALRQKLGSSVSQRRWVLEDLDFAVAPGQRIALVGPSGSGKTTLVSLLPRLYDITAGRILIDGVDVRDYKLRALRRAIGIVQQDSFLFSGSIRDNIAYGRPKASDAQVLAAAEAANAHSFICDLPEGYDSILGERGVNLSGGQRQRLSIARAILKDPRLLILDEATSALDSESEALVQEALDRLMHGRTCFVIAHRLSTVRHADRILVLQRGRIVESGTHDELVEQDQLYARLVRQQFGLHVGPALQVG